MKDYTINKNIPLEPVQNEVIEFLSKRPRAINASATGLGKTYATLTLAVHFMTRHPEYQCIILCPAKANKAFKRELNTKLFERFSLYTASKASVDPKSRFHIFNYSSLHKYFDTILSIKGSGQVFFLVDESHYLQNPESQLYKSARLVLSLGQIRWFMTATPLGNSLEGFYWMMDLLNPGCLNSIEWFKNRYQIIEYRKMTRRGRLVKIPEVVGYRNLAELKAFARNYIIIRKRDYNLQFFYRSVETEPLVMSLYKEAARGLSYEMTDSDGNKITTIRGHGARLHDLQRVLDNCHPQLGGTTFSNKEKELCKLIMEKTKINESLLIYCDYYDTIDRLEYVLSTLQHKMNISKIFKITGKQPPKERAKVEDQLIPRSIVIVSSAGCESINLQKANNVCFYDTPFAVNDVIQMVGRVARMDSTYDTMSVYFLEYKGTIDTYKKELIMKHSTLIDSVLRRETNLPTEVLEIDTKTSREDRKSVV